MLAEARDPKREVALKQHLVTRDELEKHKSGNDCWVAIGGTVYEYVTWPLISSALIGLG